MNKIDLFHPRVFDDKKWAEGYYRRNKNNIERVGKRLAELIVKSGFKEGNILDVGCGFASVPIEIAKFLPGVKITGIDLGEPLIYIGRMLIKKEGLEKQIEILKGDAHNLQYDDKSYDIIINSFMLHIVENPVQMLNEIERVAKSFILITDLRRGFLAHFIKKFRTAFTKEKASEIINNSKIRSGRLSNGPFWWDYIAGSLQENSK